MKFVLSFASLLLPCLFSLGCSDFKSEERPPPAVCKKVTLQNWHRSDWGAISPEEMCSKNLWVKDRGLIPCTLAGLPFLCRDNGQNVGVYYLSGNQVTLIDRADLEQVGEGLKFIH